MTYDEAIKMLAEHDRAALERLVLDHFLLKLYGPFSARDTLKLGFRDSPIIAVHFYRAYPKLLGADIQKMIKEYDDDDFTVLREPLDWKQISRLVLGQNHNTANPYASR